MSHITSTVVAIDDHFNSRMIRTDNLGAAKARPVNPFANRSSHTSVSLGAERSMAPEISALARVGAVYQQKVVDTRADDQILFDQRIDTHPASGTRLHTTNKLPTDGTREK